MLQICIIFIIIGLEIQNCFFSFRNNSIDKLGYIILFILVLGLLSYGINNFLGMCYMKDDFIKVEIIYYKVIFNQSGIREEDEDF